MQQVRNTSVTLVLGGVRSGKSRYAQMLAEQSDHVTFIATAEHRDDEEMRRKIERHRAERPKHWTTIEEPLQLADTIRAASVSGGCVLVDCLTLYASNLLESFADVSHATQHVAALCDALTHVSSPVILVSNEVGSGVVPAYPLGRKFRDLVGEINQQAAAVSARVVLMVAGLPMAIKGTLPDNVHAGARR